MIAFVQQLTLPLDDATTKRTRKPRERAVYCGRPSVFGNPYVGRGSVPRFVTYFRERVQRDATFRAAVLALKGRVLICAGRHRPCHVTAIRIWLRAQPRT